MRQESVQPRRRTPLQRVGCGCAVLVWLVFLLVPCFMITLATQGQITVALSDVPEHELRFWLVMDARERGIGVSLPTISQTSETGVCVQTTVQYLLWMGRGEPTVFCDCFERETADQPWGMISTAMQSCPAR
ncbi:MAG: hypothetical protein SF162_14780 [bacterium]|nr:hypothetical protein [bacterium]